LFNNLIMLFLGIEILSISVYVLTGSDKQNIRGNEAALKYFLMGAFATGILLFGIAMYYGGVGTFNIVNVTSSVQGLSGDLSVYLSVGIVFMLMGLFFKVSAAPFHFWTPDVYEGAPTVFTAFMSTVVKTAGFAAIFKMMYVAFLGAYPFWIVMVVSMTILTLLLGNIIAVYQASFKRMLAYSSISHAGYMMLALVGLRESSGDSILFYSAAYCLATITAFTILHVVSRQKLVNGRPDEQISVLNGLHRRSPFLAATLAIAMLSLAGIPLTGGFWGKFLVFSDAAARGYWWLLVVAILMSAVGMYYYFKPVRAAFFKSAEDDAPLEIRPVLRWVLVITTAGTILLGLVPGVLRQLF
jgi:NADH-quinone oxidoreductase subunit N